jgi:Flp pilus assembly protein TadD
MSSRAPFGHTTPSRARRIATLAALLASSLTLRAQAQPTYTGLDGRRFGVVYDVPETRDVRLLANVPYWKDATHALTCDVYLPPKLARGQKLPVVVFLNAIGDQTGNSLKDWGIYRTWPRLIATQGMIGVSMQADSVDAQQSMRRLLTFLASEQAPAGVDGQRVGVYAASANVSGANQLLFGADPPRTVRAAVLYYGNPPSDSLRRDLPVLFVVAASDAPRMGAPLDSLWRRVIAAGAPWTLEFAAGQPHAFDAFADNDDARRIVQRTIAFWRSQLLPVPQPTWARAEEREILHALYGNDLRRAAELLGPYIEKHPNDLEALRSYARVLNELRRFPEAMAALERAYRADSTNLPLTAQYGSALVQSRRYAEGARVLERAIANGWSTSLAYGQLGFAELSLGRHEAAVRHYEKAFEIGIPPGRTTRGVAAYNLACGYARLSRKDDALRMLETAVNEGGGRDMATDPDLESLRAEPRFQALAARAPR